MSLTRISARDALLRERWGEGLKGIEIDLKDRLSPNDVGTISGDRVERIGRSYIELHEAMIPFHRVIEVRRGGTVIWARVKRP